MAARFKKSNPMGGGRVPIIPEVQPAYAESQIGVRNQIPFSKEELYDLQTKGGIVDRKEGYGFLNDYIRIPQLASKVSSFFNRIPLARPAAGLNSYANPKGMSPDVAGQEVGGLADLLIVNNLENIVAGRGTKGDALQVALMSPTLVGGALKAGKYAAAPALGAGLMHEPTADKILSAGSTAAKIPQELLAALVASSKKQRRQTPFNPKSSFFKPFLP
jgi:hypothetical protein